MLVYSRTAPIEILSHMRYAMAVGGKLQGSEEVQASLSVLFRFTVSLDLKRRFASLCYPSASSTLRRVIIQVGKHFIFAVWAIQTCFTKKKCGHQPLSISLLNSKYVRAGSFAVRRKLESPILRHFFLCPKLYKKNVPLLIGG